MLHRALQRWRLLGHIDRIDRYHVAGWAGRGTGEPAVLWVIVNGKIADRIVPSVPRSDLTKLFGRRVSLGFDHVFDPPLDEGSHVAIVDWLNRHLKASPAIVSAEPILDLDSVGDGLTTAVPPGDLIFLVVGHRNRGAFAINRKPPVDFILERLEVAGVDPASLKTILDFGCGCGRILAGWEHSLGPGTKLVGCDINPKLIEFCQAHIPFAEAILSNYYPPLDRFNCGEVDFVYAASVFTHLTRPAVSLWSDELSFIIRPGGHLLLSFHGAAYDNVLSKISVDGLDRLTSDGIYVHLHGEPGQTSLGSNNYATFMRPEYLLAAFPAFEPVEMIPASDNPFMSGHDIAMLKRKP